VLYQHRQGLRLKAVLEERFVWGRSYAATRASLTGAPQRVFWALFAPLLPGLIVARMALMVWKKRRTLAAFMKALPLTAILTLSWSWGEFVGYMSGRTSSGDGRSTKDLPGASREAS